MAQQKTQTKTPGKDREMTDPPRRASQIPRPAQGSSPMSLDGPGSSGKKQTASGGKASRLPRGVVTTPAMTPRGRQSPQSTQPDSNSEGEDYSLYMSRTRRGPDPKKELARMERRAATTPAHTDPLDSPLAYKTKRRFVKAYNEFSRRETSSLRTRNISPSDVRRRQAPKEKAQASTRPAASTKDATGGINQEDISTESGSISDKENQDQPLGCDKKKSCTSDIPLSPSKRPKDSPTACPPSPPKKNRVSSKMTERSVTPIGTIVINDSDENVGNDDDEFALNDDDEIQERQPDGTPAGRDISEEDDSVPRPNIE